MTLIRFIKKKLTQSNLLLDTIMINKQRTYLFYFIALFIFSNSIFCSQKTAQCKIPGTIGNQPQGICQVIQDFNQAKESRGSKFQKSPLRLILYGPPGNGKTFIIKKIAELTNSVLIHIDGSSIVNEYQGSGAKTIQSLFKTAVQNTQEGKSVVIFIDEIDAITSKDLSKNHHDSQSAMPTLWCELIKHEDNHLLLPVFATNNITKLHQTFHNRFSADQLIEFKNPDENQRREIIQSSFMLYQTPIFNEYELNNFYNSFGAWFQKNFEKLHQDMVCSLRKINAIVIEWSTLTTIDQAINKKFYDLFKRELEVDFDLNKKLLIFALAYTFVDLLDIKTLFAQYFNIIDIYIDKVKKHFEKHPSYLDKAAIDDYVLLTDGFSIRSLIYFVKELQTKALYIENDKTLINASIAQEIINKIKENIKKNQHEWSEDERQKANDLRTKMELVNTHIRNVCHGEAEKKGVKTSTTLSQSEEVSYQPCALYCAQRIREKFNYHKLESELEDLLNKK